jgi:hypothetical protein
MFDPAEVFAWIVRAHPPAREKVSRQKLRALKQGWGLDVEPERSIGPDPGRPAEVYRDGAALLDPTPFLPTAAHASFEAWVAETREVLGDFGLQAPGLECASFDAFDRLQAVLAPVLRLTGPRTYRLNAFAGDYRRTPFGFHVDPHQEGVFQVVLAGHRTASFWEGLVLGDDDATWVEDANGRATPRRPPDHTFELAPGDVVFWPGTHVHGMEAAGPSMALSIVVDRASPRERADVVVALEVATMGGRAARPDVDPHAEVDPGATLTRRSAFAIAYERHDDDLVVGVCGRVFDWPHRSSIPAAMRLFDHLNAVDTATVKAVVAACADETLGADDVRETLAMLVGMGFLRA